MVRIGIVGVGIISEFHLLGLGHTDARIVAIADTNEQRAHVIADEWKAAYYSDYNELIADENVDAVIVALPNHMHHKCCVAALDAGKHVFCEKPMTTRVEDSIDLVHRARKAGRLFQVGYMKRFHPGFRAVKESLARCGAIEFANFHIYLSGAVSRAPGFLPSRWHEHPTLTGGGILVHSGSHTLDLVHFYFGDVKSVQAEVRYREDSGGDYYVHARITMANGVWVQFQIGLIDVPALGPDLSHVRNGWDEYMEIVGTEGLLRVENPTWQGYKPSRLVRWFKGMVGPEQLWVDTSLQWIEEMKSFVRGVESGRLGGPSVVDGYNVDKTIECIYASNRERREVALTEGARI